MGDHTEVVEVHFDPKQLSYRDLLRRFWQDHNPGHPPWSRQYMSLIVCNSPEQYVEARDLAEGVKAQKGGQLFTEIQQQGTFYRAEDYHQKYRLQHQHDLVGELQFKYPNPVAMLDSPTATRLNAYLGGAGSRQQLKAELPDYGLSERAQCILMKSVRC